MRLHLRGLCKNALNAGPALILEDGPGVHRLVIGVPACEAACLAHEVQRGPLCDPSIFTAAAAFIGGMPGLSVEVWIDMESERMVAQVRLGGGQAPVPCAPRDAVVLAAVAGLPIFAGASLARQVQRCPADGPPVPLPDPRAWLDRVRPEDFA